MDFIFRKAGVDDIGLLTQLRIEVLRTINHLTDDTDFSEAEENTRSYYEHRFKTDLLTAWLAYDDEQVIGEGGISFYQSIPTYHNPTGKRACIMHMYIHPDYPGKEITSELLNRLIEEAKKRNIQFITFDLEG